MPNQNREKLLNIAFDEIYHNGYYATSIDKILKKANMNKGSMYYYFKSKKELALAVINDKVSEYIENKYSVLLNKKADFIIEMIKLFNDEKKFDFLTGCKLNNLVQELSHKDDDFKQALEKIYFRFEEIIEKVLEKAVKNNEIRCLDTKKLSLFIVSVIEGSLGAAKKSQNKKYYEDSISQLELFLNSIKL